MCHTTGLTRDRVEESCVLIHRAGGGGWPPILGLFRSVVVTLAYLRRNRLQAELAEAYGVSQSMISRAVSAVTPILAQVLTRGVPTADDLDDRRTAE
ncbi:transposase family protein [Actinokineospora inagensis]|uniref:transposase family protein n=1 Tax=Actinokineospora inagensis TaxID=103730 RepID=UPI002480FD92|nr:transposase family protein [Actinokineospora inagensis]